MAQSGAVHIPKSFQKLILFTRTPPPAVDTLVQDLIQIQVAQHPDSQAVCSWDGILTYAELDSHSSRLAKYLATRSIGPEVIVPLCFEKSVWTIVSLLAVLKAGGAFLLLDPSQPIARLESIVRQAAATFALSSVACFSACKSLVDHTFVVDATTISKLESNGSWSVPKLDNAAYVIFTSGSSGTPKGVVIEHSQLATTSTYCGKRMAYGKTSRVFQFASYAFDACITDIFATLVHGGTVCIPSEWERNNAIVDSMRRMEVTSAKFTPSLVMNLVIENVPTLTTLILGGESSPPSLIEEWAPKLRLILVYGPTECCVICFISDANQHKPAPGEIGRPVSARGWIVKQDNYHELAEFGETGELLVEGPIVGRGYLNDKDKTDRQFIDDPEWMPFFTGGRKQCRLYRTGDLAKYLDDGRVCYAGRIDNQVKIRGQRLELEEVEKRLYDSLAEMGVAGSNQLVVEAVTLHGLTSKQLVAFLCLSTPESIGCLDWDAKSGPALLTSTPEQGRFSKMVTKIEAMLKVELPAYAVPSIWIPLRHLPFTVSKKIDRKRLRSIVAPLSTKQLVVFANLKAATSSVKALVQLTENESKLQTLLADVFRTRPSTIEPDDNFFSLGGDSVLAIKLVAAARASGLDLSLEIIFRHPVLCQMAQGTKTLAIQEGDFAAIPPFSLLDCTSDISPVCQEASRVCSIAENCIEDIYPCSPMQEGLFALSMKDLGTYILQFVYQMPESVDLDKLKAAWQTITKRTEVLRTRFFDYNSELLQVVVDEPNRWEVTDGNLAGFLAMDKKRRMNLGEALSRQTVIHQHDSRQYYLVWTVHHALVDGWSESDIVNWVELEYFGTPTATLTIPKYNSFIKYVQEQNEESAQEFWRQQLTDVPAPVFPSLPDPRYIPKVQRANRVLHHLSSAAEAELEHKVPSFKLSSATAATMIQAAWFLLVGIYSNSSDVVTGVTLNGRTAPIPCIDSISGPTVTTVPFRTRFTSDQKISELLHMIQNQYLSILPFAQFGLQNIRSLSEDAVAACKFRSLLVVQSANRPQKSRQLLLGRSYSFPVMDFAIVMECELCEGSIDFRATFDHHVLSEEEVRRIFQQMEDILRKISVSGPETRVSDLQKISQADVQQISQWNSMPITTETTRLCVHEFIEQRALKRGNSPAICAWDGDLDYETLDKYSSRLAAYLQMHHHIGPQSLVGICFEKSLWAVVSMLAVLKSGSTCVPLDPSVSTERLQTIISRLGESFANLILSSSTCTELLGDLGATVLAVEPEMVDVRIRVGLASNTITPCDAAFVVFPSESSRVSDGIMLEHQAFCSGALAWDHLVQLDDKSRVFQFSAYSYHISVWEMFSTLIHGGCICIPSEHDRMANLSGAIESLRATHLYLSPTLASYLLPEVVPNVRVLVTVGEAMTKEVIEKWADHVTLINMYSPAECAVPCIGKVGIQRQDHHRNIGRGVGALTWIVDPEDSNSLTPICGVGEILVEGPILARGYLGNESETGKSFIIDPTWSRSNSSTDVRRFYKTGDLGSYNSDGSIAFVGRNDGQLQLQGQRVDIAEVEHRLRESISSVAGVTAAMVYPSNGSKTLAAWVVVNGGQGEKLPYTLLAKGDEGKNITGTILASSAKGLEQFRDLVEGVETKLHSILPGYMVPSLYIPIFALPLTASAKVDRKRLQYLASTFTTDELSSLRGHNATMRISKSPSTSKEKRIASLWKKLLDTDQIGVDDNFFHLGGGSVLAMRLVSLARSEGMTMTVGEIFKTPTLKDLALKARENVSTDNIAPFALLRGLDIADLRRQTALQCGIRAEVIEDIYPCSAMQLHYVTGYPEAKKAPSSPWDWQSQVVYSLPSSIDVDKFKAVWDSAIRCHLSLRTRLVNTSSGIFQVVIKDLEPLPWKVAHDLDRCLQEDRSDNMKFGDRLLRLAIVGSEAINERFFVMTIQHIIYDAFARSMLFKEIESTYFQGDFPDPPLPKMNHFIKYITEADKAAATEFWTSYLSDAVTKPLLATPSEDRAVLNQTEQSMIMPIPKVHNPEPCTLATMIEVAVGLAIAHSLDCPDVILYSDRSGRNLPVAGIQDLIGPTTLFLPVRIHIHPQQKISELLRTAQYFQTAMMPYEHLGWLELREMDHLKPVLQHSLNMNINPHRLTSMGRGLGLKLKSSHASCDDPFGINVDLFEGEMEWVVYYDERFIEGNKVGRLLGDIKHAFEGLADKDRKPDMTVGEILDSLRQRGGGDMVTRERC